MARQRPGGDIGFWLLPNAIEPTDDPAWALANDTIRRQFWAAALPIAVKVWGDSREAGLDRFGRPLAALSPRTIKHRRSAKGPADPHAPPLIPAHAASRTRSYLRYRYEPGQGGYFYWRYDPRTHGSWGQILQYHALGMVRRAPIRDVLGFSDRDIDAIRSQMDRWWAARRRRVLTAPERRPKIELKQKGLEIRLPEIGRVVPRPQRKALPWALPAKIVRNPAGNARGRKTFQFRSGA